MLNEEQQPAVLTFFAFAWLRNILIFIKHTLWVVPRHAPPVLLAWLRWEELEEVGGGSGGGRGAGGGGGRGREEEQEEPSHPVPTDRDMISPSLAHKVDYCVWSGLENKGGRKEIKEKQS